MNKYEINEEKDEMNENENENEEKSVILKKEFRE